MKQLLFISLISLLGSSAHAVTSNYSCDEKDLIWNDNVAGASYTVTVDEGEFANVFLVIPHRLIDTLKTIRSSSGISATYAEKDSKGRLTWSFDTLTRSKKAVLIIRNYRDEAAIDPRSTEVRICTQKK